ncbi:hypothetical protein BDB00DRAFT_744914, partial [Zychaea mexicana]|uniref:uncharacterized protein n=1 Tax=Zychaea mexicana TaxID=64656 RepID=UPI0022FEC7EC
YIPVFFFLVMIFNKYDYKGPYNFLEKGLIILYHLITGNSYNMKLENKLSDYECIAFDGGYYYYIEKFIENCERKGNDKINRNNFMYLIRKEINIDLTDDEILYNETFGSFRSKIESCFGQLGNKFKRFNNNEKTTRITDIKVYNLQLKLALLLLNIQKFCNVHNIPVKPNHMLWANNNFNYPNPNNSTENII